MKFGFEVENLKGNIDLGKVFLKNFINLNEEEKEKVRNWRNHPEVRKWMYSTHEISKEEHEEFIENLKKDYKNFYYLVYKEGVPIGVLTLTRIDFQNRHVYWGVYANPEDRVPGAGIILEKAALRLAFEVAKLHSLKLEVIEDNEKAIKFYKKVGFLEEGRLKEFVFRDGRWKDVIVMGMTEERYFSLKT